MRLRRLEITRFRGIRALDWRHIGNTVAIVGPGDSGKSTTVDAIERVLTPRWNFPFDDADFWNVDTSQPIVVRATLTDLPAEFFRDTKFGLCMQVYDQESGTAIPSTEDRSEPAALVVELRVDETLEPKWNVIDEHGGEHRFQAGDREALGMLRVGDYVDHHLAWSRTSTLTRLTSSGDAVTAVLAEATRQARTGVKQHDLVRLNEAAEAVERLAGDIGVSAHSKYRPHLDVGSLSIGSGSLSLHDGDVPLRRAGLGTRRLLAIAMQREAASTQGLTLVDEFEHGLEPHRIRKLLRVLRGRPPENKGAGVHEGGQLILTTHSPTVLAELEPSDLFVAVRASDDSVAVECLPDDIKYVVRRVPSALLARRVVVLEGATEEGILTALDEFWEQQNKPSFSYCGVAVVDGGGGTQPAEVAGALHRLGYDVALLIDSDAKAKPSRAEGAKVLQWPGGMCTEERLALDLPRDGLSTLVDLATRSTAKGFRSVRDCLAQTLGIESKTFGDDPTKWLDLAELSDGIDEQVFRQKFGRLAHEKDWFKTRALGRELGAIVCAHWDALKGTPTRDVFDQVDTFAHDG
ncbi:MAG: AAA family ATPase [Myxococcales bacterium]|nr:AAA family ATPase [Myxococcales bacterium]